MSNFLHEIENSERPDKDEGNSAMAKRLDENVCKINHQDEET